MPFSLLGEGDFGFGVLLGASERMVSVSEEGCLRFRDLSCARRSFRAAAAASREAIDDITKSISSRGAGRQVLVGLEDMQP